MNRAACGAVRSPRPWLALCALVVVAGCTAAPAMAPTATVAPPAATSGATDDPGVLAPERAPEDLRSAVPALAERDARFAAALAGDQTILTLEDGLDERQRRAQALAVADPDFRSFARDPETDQPVRSEVMMVRPALPADLTGPAEDCDAGACYRVELFNYSTNATATGIVDVRAGKVLAIAYHPDSQPEIPAYLADLAAQIAIHSPEVADALGFTPGVGLAGMPNVKTALNGTQCERSHHLCVAPTFLRNEEGRALWAVVDLTDGRLVGVRWTETGRGDAQPVTEQSLQDAVVMSDYCETSHALERDGWSLTYVLTPSDGLEIRDVAFQGRSVVRSAKIVDWHVSYSGEDGFGYSDASGCPLFSTASVVAFNGPVVEDHWTGDMRVGFTLSQDFRSELWPLPCNYRYVHRFEFYADGSLFIDAQNLGRGCGNNGTYHPVFRVALATGPQADESTFARWQDGTWITWAEEGWAEYRPGMETSPEGHPFRVLGGDGTGVGILPEFGPPTGPSRDEAAFVYVTARHPDEGDADMVTIGPCCNTDYQQGPEKFLTPPEPIEPGDLVVWFVPRLKNDDTAGRQHCWTETVVEDGIARPEIFPCNAGLLLAPTKSLP